MPSVPDSDDTWIVSGAYLLTEGDDGGVAVPDLELTFFDDGIAVDKSDGEAVWNAAWSDLAEMSTIERAELPDGQGGVVVVIVERGGRPRLRHRFVLPADDPASTELSIQERARAHRLRTNLPKQAVSRALMTVVVLAAAATLTALLLAAVHVIHF
jgi:hypothetical protein